MSSSTSGTPLPPLTLLQRREIEAKVVGPLIRGFAAEIGDGEGAGGGPRVIVNLAHEAGAELAGALGEASLEAFARGIDRWKEGGALEIDVLEQSPDRLSFNVTRCKYAEMYRALGLADLGGSLSCQRDFALIEGVQPRRVARPGPGRSWEVRLALRLPVPGRGPSRGLNRWIDGRLATSHRPATMIGPQPPFER